MAAKTATETTTAQTATPTDARSDPDTLARRAQTRTARRNWAEKLYPFVVKTPAGFVTSVVAPDGSGAPVSWNITETDPELATLLERIDKAAEEKRNRMRDLFADPEAAAIARQLLADQPALPDTDTAA